jgi:hypothetical protein
MSQNNSSLHHLQKKALEVHTAFEQFGQNVHAGVQDLQQKFAKPLGDIAAGAARMVHHFQQQISSHLSAPVEAPQMAFAVSILKYHPFATLMKSNPRESHISAFLI